MNSTVYDMPFDKYKNIKRVHKSHFGPALKSGLHYKYHIENEEYLSPSDFMVFGSLVDTILFEPKEINKRFVCHPEKYDSDKGEKTWNWNANACKKWRSNLEKLFPGIMITGTEIMTNAAVIASKIKNHPVASKWLEGTFQVSLLWTDEDTGIECKSRPDIILGSERIVDLKITSSPHPFGFGKKMLDLNYHSGAAFYHDGYLIASGCKPQAQPSFPMSFIVAEDSPPYDVVCYDLGIESFDVGRIVYRQALERISEYRSNDEYPGYSNIVETAEIPTWAINRVQMEGMIE